MGVTTEMIIMNIVIGTMNVDDSETILQKFIKQVELLSSITDEIDEVEIKVVR